MRNRWLGAGLALVALFGAPAVGRVQAQENYSVPGLDAITVPLPLGHDRYETGGFYAGLEFFYMIPNRTFGKQLIAIRGFVDTTGATTGNPLNPLGIGNVFAPIGGLPGLFQGSGTPALSTDQLSEVNWQPGVRYTLGYRFDDGVAVQFSYLQMFDTKQTATAAGSPPGLSVGANATESFLFAPVFNFPSDFAGPAIKTTPDAFQFNTLTLLNAGAGPPPPSFIFPPGGTAYGIWNGASNMEIALTRRFAEGDITVRLPIWQTDYASTYALAGGRFAWLFDRFWWRTQSIGLSPGSGAFQPFGPGFPNSDPANLRFTTVSFPTDVAVYTLTLSQRMYGPFLGCGYEAYLGNGFALNTDLTGALLVNLIKERAKYKLGDHSVQNKRSRNLFDVVPNVNADINLTWYPIRGVQLRAGYNFLGFFNAKAITKPIGFNYGAIEYETDNKFIRFYNGINFGAGLTF